MSTGASVPPTEKIAELEERIAELEEKFAWIKERIEGKRVAAGLRIPDKRT